MPSDRRKFMFPGHADLRGPTTTNSEHSSNDSARSRITRSDEAANHHHPILREGDRRAIGEELQRVLVILCGLTLIGKHALWNVVGRDFVPMRLQLDEMIDAWRLAADAVAQRASALGQPPDGRLATIAATSPLASLRAGPLIDQELLASLARILSDAAGIIRTRNEFLQDVDGVSAALLHGVSATLEQHHWMIRAQSA